MINVLVSLECFEWGTFINLKIWSCNRVIGLGLKEYNGLQGEKWYDNAYCFVFLHSSFSVFEKADVIWMDKVEVDEVNIQRGEKIGKVVQKRAGRVKMD